VNDPRGPKRKAVKVSPGTAVTQVELQCGHVAKLNPIFMHRIGDFYHCYQCSKETRTTQK
jgi:hypothetical protein